MNELVDLYQYTRECNSEINRYVAESIELIDLLEESLTLESVMLEESEEAKEDTSKEMEDTASEKIDDILDKASDNIKAERLSKTLKKTADRVKRVESIVSSISKAKVRINNTWSFKKYIDKELDKLLKSSNPEEFYGKTYLLTGGFKNNKIESLSKQMHQMAAIMRVPAKVKIDSKGRATEDIKRRDLTRQGNTTAATYLTSGIIVDFAMMPLFKRYGGQGTAEGIAMTVAKAHPIQAIKRMTNGIWGEPYETVTIDELYKRIRELDPEHFGTIADNEISDIRKFFSRNKKMSKLSKINAESSRKAVSLAGLIVNLQADYTAYRQAIVNYYITIINRTFSLLNKGKAAAKKIKEEK